MSKSGVTVLLPAFLLAFCELAHAQAPTGNISGAVRDEVGAVIPNATVTITNKATDFNRALSTNAEGLYSAPALVPGEYDVRVEMQGFRTLVRPATVVAGGSTTVDLALSLGTAQEVVTVEAASAQINYDSHTVAGVIARENIQDLPLNGRSSLQLASLEPGVTVNPGATSQFNAMFNISILGSNGGATAGSGVGPLITMDGGVINDEVEGGTSMNFSQEVVQEFQISVGELRRLHRDRRGRRGQHRHPLRQQQLPRQLILLLPRSQHGGLSRPEAQRVQPQPILRPPQPRRVARRPGHQGQALLLL